MADKPIRFSLFTKSSGILTKEISLSDGKLIKNADKCRMSEGSVARIECDFLDFPEYLNSIAKNQAIAIGISEKPESKIVCADALKRNKADAIARSLEFFKFSNLILLDIDSGESDTLDRLSAVFPAFRDTDHVISYSASSGIRSADGLIDFGGKGGLHIYFCVTDTADIKRFADSLFKRCWLSGMGEIFISKAGSLHTRTVFDAAVFSPERLIFESDPVLSDNLTQNRKRAEFHKGTERRLNTSLLQSLDVSEAKDFQSLVSEAKQAKKTEAETVKTAHIQERIPSVMQRSRCGKEQAEKALRSAYEKSILSPEMLLHFDGADEPVTVAAVLKNPAEYNGKSLRDPVEPEYGCRKAKFYQNQGGKSVINSYAHGSRTYFFQLTTRPDTTQSVSDIQPFWYWDAKKEAVKISYEQVYQFLIKNGFFNSSFSGKTMPYRIVANRISMIDMGDIRRCIREFLDALPEEISPEIAKQVLLNLWTAGISRYINEPIIQSMPKQEVNFHSDTEGKTYLYFRDGVLEISADGGKPIPYAELDKVIWESEILPYDLPRNEPEKKHPFSLFLNAICTDPDTGIIDQGRRDSLCTVIGYLLHRYRDQAYPRAVVFTDGCLDDTPNGGTGKGILMKSIGKCRKVTDIDGKTHNPTNQFCLQRVDQDTRIILFDDVKKNFDFETYFSMITEGFQIEGKNEKQIRFTPEKSPKLAITTNFSLRGIGASHERRKFEMELLPFFNNDRTPESVNGIGRMFSTWNDSLWTGFFAVMAECSCAYHRNKNRILDYKSDTLDKKKLRFEVGISFIDFAEDIPLNEPVLAAELIERYKGVLSDKEKSFVNNTNFGLKIKAFCKSKGYVLDTDRNGHGKKTRYILKTPESEEADLNY